MDHLPSNAISIYTEFLQFSSIRIPFLIILLSVLKYFKNDVEWLCARLICLCETRDEVLVRSELSSMWFNKECDLVFQRIDDNSEMSIYDFMTLPSWGDAKVAKESHHLSLSLLECVPSHTTMPAAEGAMIGGSGNWSVLILIPLPTPDEIDASLQDPHLAKKSKGPAQVRVCLDLDAAAEPSRPSKKSKLKKKALEVYYIAPELGQAEGINEADLTNFYAEIERLGATPSMAVVSASEPSHVGTLAHASTFRRSLSLRGMIGHAKRSGAEVLRHQVDPLDFLARSALARDVEYDQILEDDFGTATHGEEIDLTLFPLTPGPYQMSYLAEFSLYMSGFGKESSLGETELTDVRVASIGLLEELSQTDAKLSDQALVFVGSSMESLVWKLLSSDEFHAALACLASLGINYSADFDKALVDFPTAPFPFLGKIDAASEGNLFEVTQVLSNKHVRSFISASVVPPISNEDADQVPLEHATDAFTASI
ncbi:hypothetical protein Tco_0150702 [Tanacetum coccineum]